MQSVISMHQSTHISLYDDEDDLELHDVTKELENLKAVFSRYDNHAVKLQNELELVREDLYGLIHARGTKPDNEDNVKPNEIKLTQEDFETIKLINEKQAKKMLSLKKKAHAYKSNFNVLLQELDKQKVE
ncbi:unnamed protein product [Trichobilharzia szidati]|nr:unnamed protein product [Trichobilharzia szidati]